MDEATTGEKQFSMEECVAYGHGRARNVQQFNMEECVAYEPSVMPEATDGQGDYEVVV